VSTLERATEVYESGHCPGCGLPFTQVSVDATYHDPEDGSPVDHELGAARCTWTSDDLYTTQLIATGVVKISGGGPSPQAPTGSPESRAVDAVVRTLRQIEEDAAADRMQKAEWDGGDAA
jgi:hypothetical protein